MQGIPLGRYRHFKGNDYEVLGVATDSESDAELVIYRALYGSYRLFARPQSMFQEQVTRDGVTQPRFAYVGPADVRKLAPEGWRQACAFLFAHARPLEQAHYRHLFEGGAAAAVLAALGTFQHADGGFGHGLEPDVQAPGSSVLATTTALQLLRQLGAGPEEPLVAGALRYLLDACDEATGRWPIIPPAAEAHPHAFWWDAEGLAERFGHFWANPSAEVLGYLNQFRVLLPPSWRDRLALLNERILAELAAAQTLSENELLCLLRLAATPGLPTDMGAALRTQLQPHVLATVARDPAAWTGYVLQPLAVASTPPALFADVLGELVQQNLDFLIGQQQEDGAWPVPWSWAARDSASWAVAWRAWQGVLTLEALCRLEAWGRVAR